MPHFGPYHGTMTRPLRIEFPGALYHLTTRGNARADIFVDDIDRDGFLAVLSGVVARWGWLCHVYCLMGNHYHLVVTTPEANLSRGMRQLNGVYTQRFNRRHDRVGHLFQGRYGAVLVERDAHLLELARYVVLNPVRAGMVRRAGDWPWSSHRAMTGDARAPDWFHGGWLLRQFGARPAEARRGYADFVRDGAREANPWRHLKGQSYLGGDSFAEAMAKRLEGRGDSTEIPRVQRAAAARPLESYAAESPTRHDAMVRAYATGAYSMARIARHFGVHYSTVSRILKRGRPLDGGR